MKSRRIKIVTNIDRPHITYDILTVLKDRDIGILMMEVYTYVIYIKLPYIDDELLEDLNKDISNISDVEFVEEIDLIAFEERDMEMNQIIDTIPQGVVVLDEMGSIKYSNTYFAERILKLTSESIKNRKLDEFIDGDVLANFINAMNNGNVRNYEFIIDRESYLADLTPIKTEHNMSLGYILSLNEFVDQHIFDNQIGFNDILGESRKIHNIKNKAKRHAKEESPIFLYGEKGTGKEMMARAIHNSSSRKNNAFIPINCESKPEKIIEEILFGFSNDGNSIGKIKKNYLELADGGTLYLDEVGSLTLNLQYRLLDFMKTNEIISSANGKKKTVDIRIMCSSSKDMNKLMVDKLFRTDLFYRLNILTLEVPSLRDRKEDIPIFTEYFLRKQIKSNNLGMEYIEPGFMTKLYNHSWPGNIRELQNVIDRAFLLMKQDRLFDFGELLIRKGKDFTIDVDNMSLNDVLGKIERDIIVKALKSNKTIRGTARKLDVTHTLLINRIKKYEIDESEWKI